MARLTLKTIAMIGCSLLLCQCSGITESFANLGTKPRYKSSRTIDRSLLLAPPRVDLGQYQSVHRRPKQRSDVAVALAASGGGYRAANLTAGVLIGLESLELAGLEYNLLQEVDYFSTVSGGGFPISLYLNYEKHRQLAKDSKTPLLSFKWALEHEPYSLKKRLRENLSNPLFQGYRSGIELEQLLYKNFAVIGDTPTLTLGDMFIRVDNAAQQPQLPMWITNATILQSRQLFQFTPDVLNAYHITRYIHNLMIEDIEPARSEQVYGAEIPAAVGMVASATFPYAIAGTTLWSDGCKNDCFLQLFDGGLVDNLGLFTVLELLRQDPAKKKVLIIVDAFQGNQEPFSESRLPPRRLSLLQNLLLTSAESLQRNVKSAIPLISKTLLCEAGAEQVVIAYLDLSQYEQIEQVSAGLWITEDSQNQLIKAGKHMVQNSEALSKVLPKMLHDVQVAHC